MAYARFNTKQQLGRVARGKSISTPIEILAALVLQEWSATAEKHAPKDDDVRFLERLYALEDPRP